MHGLFEAITDWARETAFDQLDALLEAVALVNCALEDYVVGLNEKPVGNTFVIGIDMSPEQLREMAARFMEQTLQTIETLRGTLVSKYQLDPNTDVEALHTFLNQKFAVELKDGDVSTVLDVYRSERDKILSFIEGSGLFPVPEDQDMQIMMTPGFLQPVIPAGAM